MRGLMVILVALFFLPIVNAMTFPEDTSFSQGNIKYTFKEGVIVDNFDISSNDLKINNAEDKISLTVQGGQFEVIIYQFDIVKKIGFKSSVPQLVQFKITSGGENQYLYDGKSYYLSNYNIDTEEVIFEYKDFDKNSSVQGNKTNEKIEILNWWQKKIIEFEISSSIDEDGIINNKTVAISYLWLIISILGLVIGGFIWSILRN